MLLRHARRWLIFVCAMLVVGVTLAATQRFDYDPLGRLIRVLDEQNRVTTYRYDAAGNLEQVQVGATVTPPAVTAMEPSRLRRNQSARITITGSGLDGVDLNLLDPALSISNLQGSANQLTFTLTAGADATIGSVPIQISSAAGSTSAAITIMPLLPTLNIDPTPLAIPPDSKLRQFTLRLSNADAVDHTITLAASNNNIALSPSTVTIPAGQLSTVASIKGTAAGQASIQLTSTTLGTTTVPVFLTAEFVGISTSMAPNLGVVLESNAPPSSIQIGPQVSPQVGVLVGSALQGLMPDRVAAGAAQTGLIIQGVGLQGAQAVTVEPATGIVLGAPVVAADGKSIQVPVSVAADATFGERRIVVTDAAGKAFLAAHPLADRLQITRNPPEIQSIEPLFGAPETTVTLTIRGRNLHQASGIALSPSRGIAADAAPVVNAEGTVLTAQVALGPDAAVGAYTVTATTPAGPSSAAPGPGNTFRVVAQVQGSVTPIAAPLLGVVLADPNVSPATPVALATPALGVAVGPVATSLAPAAAIAGQTSTLTVQGNDLSGVSAISVIPGDGITVGQIALAGDGKSLTVPLTVAADAPRTSRRVKLMAGSAELPFASAAAAQLLVSLPAPELASVTPVVLPVGQAATPLVIRGRNFENASRVKVTPGDGITISDAPAVNDGGTELAVSVVVGAGAAPGARLVTVVTPAGESSATLTSANTLTLTDRPTSTVTPIMAPALGVVVLGGTPDGMPVGPIVSPGLGIVLLEVPTPVSTDITQYASQLGVVVGPAALRLGTTGFAPGFVGNLIVQGQELSAVTGVAVTPAAGLVLGTPMVSADGKQVTVPMRVDGTAAPGARHVTLTTASGPVEFTSPAAAQLHVGPGVPELDSLTPILARRGELVTMTIRGRNLQGALAVTATPDGGITFANDLAVNENGTELTVRLVIDPAAAIGSRVMQVTVPGAISAGDPRPSNTFTVIAD